MKTAILSTLVLLLFGCNRFKTAEELYAGKWILRNYHSNGFEYTAMVVDSLQMKSTKEADVWVNGKKQKVFGAKLSTIYYPIQ